MSHQPQMSALDRFNAHPLSTFLRQFRVEAKQGQEASVCGMGHLKGRWLIPDDKYENYFDLLADYLFRPGEEGRPLSLVEQPRLDQPKPLLLDLDFKFPLDVALTHRFNNGHIRTFVRSVVDGLSHFFDLSAYQSLRFFVSLRPQAYQVQGKAVKDGIHIQCPDIALSNEKQKVLRAWVLENQAIPRAFEGIGYVNEQEDIYDESMVRKQGWFFYGESKPSIRPYALSTVFAFDPDSGGLEQQRPEAYTNRELLELLSVRYNISEDDNEVREERMDEFDRYLKPPRTAPPPREMTREPAPEGGGPTATPAIGVYIPETYDAEEVELARQIALECLSDARADAYQTWKQTGWCLYNIDPSDEMFETFVLFSKKSGKADGTDWESQRRDWHKGYSRNTPGAKLTLKSLHYWAREDNKEHYEKLIEEDHVRFAQYRVDDTHFHVAKLLRRMYKGNFCASVEQRRTEWYRFDERIHTWRHTNQGMELQEKLSTEVADLIVRARQRLKKKGWDQHCAQNNLTAENATPDEDWYKKWAATLDGERFQTLVKVEKHLYQQDFKGGVMRAAVELFHEEDFGNRLNNNSYLFACKNGVLDLQNEIRDPQTGVMKKKVIFRDGRPDDYMSKLAGRNYPDSEPIEYHPYDPESEDVRELMEFLLKIFPSKDIRNYVIRLLASCLEGNNREQCYYTFIGVGGNGKSKLVDLMRYTFGEYCSSLQATALTRKRPDSGAANPDIIAIKNTRFIYLQEPDDREPLNTSRMKQFSGEDVVEARGLFEDQQRFRITGKLFMMCNNLPPIHAMDRGTWRRIRVVQFGSKFVDQSDPDLKAGRPNVFVRDNGLDAKLRRWREAWLSLLVHVYETEYMVNGLEPIPQAILDESNRYKESFDQYGKFKAERMIDFRDSRLKLQEYGNEQVTLKEVCVAYNNWSRSQEGTLTGKKLSKQDLQRRLEEDFGNLDGGVYKRCVVFYDEDAKAEFEQERSGEV